MFSQILLFIIPADINTVRVRTRCPGTEGLLKEEDNEEKELGGVAGKVTVEIRTSGDPSGLEGMEGNSSSSSLSYYFFSFIGFFFTLLESEISPFLSNKNIKHCGRHTDDHSSCSVIGCRPRRAEQTTAEGLKIVLWRGNIQDQTVSTLLRWQLKPSHTLSSCE